MKIMTAKELTNYHAQEKKKDVYLNIGIIVLILLSSPLIIAIFMELIGINYPNILGRWINNYIYFFIGNIALLVILIIKKIIKHTKKL